MIADLLGARQAIIKRRSQEVSLVFKGKVEVFVMYLIILVGRSVSDAVQVYT